MAVTLKVTPEELKKLAGQITSEVSNIKTYLNNINSEVTGTQKYWRGDASSRHISIYQELQPKADKVVEKLENAPKDLLRIAGLYEESEEVNSQMATSLPVDVFG